MANLSDNNLSGQYQSIDSKYKRNVALVTARPKLESAVLVAWGMLDVFLLGVFVFGVVTYIVSGSFADKRLSASLFTNTAAIANGVTRQAPQGLLVDDARVASVMPGKYDLYTTIENPSADWYVTFDYAFVYAGGVTAELPGSLNPGEQRTLAAINTAIESQPRTVKATLSNLVWHRVDKHVVPDPAQFIEDHSNITVEGATYSLDVAIGTEQIARSTITLQNRTPYSYWEPEFLVKLMRGNTVVSLTKVTVPRFVSGETRSVEVRWFGAVPPSASLAVEPAVPYFDPQVYMNPGDESGPDVRR